MELRVLRYFSMVVQERNISRAAKKLHVSQPTISKQLKELEDELSITLFKRGSRNIQLTPPGEYFAQQVQHILDLMDKLVVNLHEGQSVSGRILIGIGELELTQSIAEAINRLTSRQPDIQIDLFSTTDEDLHNKLQSGLFDFGIMLNPADTQNYNAVELPGDTTWGILAPQNSLLATHRVVTPDDLTQLPLITAQQNVINTQFAQWLKKPLTTLNQVATYNFHQNAARLVSAGIGYALYLNSHSEVPQSDLAFIPLMPKLTSTTSLVWSNERPPSAAAKFLIDHVYQCQSRH
ncbi:LysR family transcriptional regulator [Latilactobacillus curvatus]|uniref:LysR family transcriptional regulator n=1 Tax=Latilactobacillus curvatus TaxID=28038 RepID=UPI002411343B|nr:LysR family transcriptional regulator [Latilactobacillus curvatus]MDG2980251.1 LysR family transcriptional regulator [Latilactobacillus curvatus]